MVGKYKFPALIETYQRGTLFARHFLTSCFSSARQKFRKLSREPELVIIKASIEFEPKYY